MKITESAPQPPKDEQEGSRLPWHAPALKIDRVTEITRAGSTSSRNDGTSIYAPTS